MNWSIIESLTDFNEAILLSEKQAVLFFKHSTRCPVSYMALKKFEESWDVEENNIKPYFLDLVRFRDVSNEIERKTGVTHESPQAIVYKGSKVLYSASHHSIDANQLLINR